MLTLNLNKTVMTQSIVSRRNHSTNIAKRTHLKTKLTLTHKFDHDRLKSMLLVGLS